MPLRRTVLAALACPGWVRAAPPLRLRTPRHAAGRDTLGGYAPALLALALARAPRRYEVVESVENLAQGRAMVEMQREAPPIDVFWTVPTLERQAALRAIRIPVERGLIGWRLALVRAADRDRWRGVTSVGDLARAQAGQKHDWPDTAILRANGLPVQTVTQYESLFQMLALGRIDYFPRSVLEIEAEASQHAAMGLVIEPHLVLRYPSPLYFFVAPSRAELAEDIRAGLEQAQADGSFEKLFQAHFRSAIDRLQLAERRVLELRNPLLPQDAPVQRADWWFRPPRP